jgi:hypothetical protein
MWPVVLHANIELSWDAVTEPSKNAARSLGHLAQKNRTLR